MKQFAWWALSPLVLLLWACQPDAPTTTQTTPAPKAAKQTHLLVTHGDTLVDNYYWMRLTDAQKSAEKPDAQTTQVLDYLKAENAYTKHMLQSTDSLQARLYNEMVGRTPQKDESVPYFENGYWHYLRFDEGKEYPIYCRKKGKLTAPEEVLIDQNELAMGKAYYQISGFSVSPDNRIVAFGEDTLSRRIYTIRFFDLQTRTFLPDRIAGTEGPGAWANDSRTVFYTAKNETTLLSEKIYRYTLGGNKPQMVYHERDSSFYIGVSKSKSGQYIVIWCGSTLSSDYHILDANQPNGSFRQFAPRERELEYTIEHYRNKFYVLTNWQAKNFRLMETPAQATNKSNWKEVLPHRPDVLIEGIEVFKNHLVVNERKQGNTLLRIIETNTRQEHYIDFGEEVYTARLDVNREFDTDSLRYSYSSLTTPNSVFGYHMGQRQRVLKKQQQVVGGFDPSLYEAKRLWAPARDGKQIPISIVYKKGPNNPRSLLLYGYGSYGYTVDPMFSIPRISLLERGFAFAIAHVRGGQFLGREWYEDGKMLHKRNTFNDYIDCAKYLIDQGYTSPNQLFGQGGSAGGLLMGAVANMAPELFRGIVAAVPFVDVMATMSDPTIPLTTNEYDQWGNPADSAYYFYMKSYSPYDNVRAAAYPNMLVTTGLFDSQVQYWEPAKWVAKLRELKTDNNLLLLHTNLDAGHGGASGRFKRFHEVALEYAFMLHLAGIHE